MKKCKRTGMLVLLGILATVTFAQPVDSISLRWFQDAKLGLFLHWGLYSQTAGDWKGHPTTGGEHFMLYERIPLKEYALIANDFNPVDFDASRWVKMAKKAGMRYVIITSKHHDGFSMYDSKCNDYNIVRRTPFAHDPMADLIKACRKEGLKFGFYYSLGRDWEDPDVPTNWPTKAGRSNTWDYPDEDAKDLNAYIERKVKPQLRELLTQYGKIDFIWFDTPEMVTAQQSAEIRELIHSLQDGCLINNRIGNGYGDYAIVEQALMEHISLKPWEACLTMGKNWGYNRYDTIYKEPDALIRNFTDIVSKGGNMLLNVGPDGKGNFSRLAKDRLRAFHDWMEINKEAIYGTRPWSVYGETLSANEKEIIDKSDFHDAVYDGTPQNIVPDIRYTCKNNTVYVIVRNVRDLSYTLKSFSSLCNIISVTCLGEEKNVKWSLEPDGLNIEMKPHLRRPSIYVLKVVLKA